MYPFTNGSLVGMLPTVTKLLAPFTHILGRNEMGFHDFFSFFPLKWRLLVAKLLPSCQITLPDGYERSIKENFLI